MKFLLVFLVGFARDFLATLEVRAIAQGALVRATCLAGAGDLAWFALTYLISRPDSGLLAIPSMVGNVLATYLAVRSGRGPRRI